MRAAGGSGPRVRARRVNPAGQGRTERVAEMARVAISQAAGTRSAAAPGPAVWEQQRRPAIVDEDAACAIGFGLP